MKGFCCANVFRSMVVTGMRSWSTWMIDLVQRIIYDLFCHLVQLQLHLFFLRSHFFVFSLSFPVGTEFPQ